MSCPENPSEAAFCFKEMPSRSNFVYLRHFISSFTFKRGQANVAIGSLFARVYRVVDITFSTLPLQKNKIRRTYK